MTMRKTTTLALLACLAAAPAVAQGADDPGYQVIDGVGVCVLGGGALDAATAALADLGWIIEPNAVVVNFRPAKGDAVFGVVTTDGTFCRIESTALGTEDAQTMFNLFFTGGNSGIEVTGSGTDTAGCTVHTLSNGGVVTLTAGGGGDAACVSETTSALQFSYSAAN
jgi:hypothetical protein